MQWRKFLIGAALGLACLAFFNHEIDAAVSRLKVWSSAETLTASDLNGEFNNILTNGEDLAWPASKAKDLNAQVLQLDADADTTITADTDDRIDFALSGTDLFRFDGTVATPVNGLDFTASATGADVVISAVGTDADIDIDIQPKGTGTVLINSAAILANIVDDTTPQLGAQLDVNGFALGDGTLELLTFTETGSAINQLNVTNAAVGTPPILSATGDDTDIGIQIRSKGTGDVILADASGEQILIGNDVASAINEITVHNAAIGTGPKIEVTGDDTNVDLTIETKGTGDVLFFADALELMKIVQVASAVNFPQFEPSATLGPVKLSAFGDDTDVGIELQPKGAGTVTVGTEQVVLTKLDTAQVTTSGTLFTFTSPFTTTVQVDVMFDGVSKSGTDEMIVQIGDAGGIEATGYTSQAMNQATVGTATTGFIVEATGTAANLMTGRVTLELITGTTWISSGLVQIEGAASNQSTGESALDTALTTVTLDTNGTDTFDAGQVNVRWYGY